MLPEMSVDEVREKLATTEKGQPANWSAAWLGTGVIRQRKTWQRRWICGTERGRSPSAGTAKGVDRLNYMACCGVDCYLVAGFVAGKTGMQMR